MSATDLTKAIADARQAEDQTARIAEILAVVQAAQAPAPQHAACSCSQPKSGGWSTGKTVAVVGGGAACACVLTGMFLAIAVVAAALIVCGPIGYLLMREIRKGK